MDANLAAKVLSSAPGTIIQLFRIDMRPVNAAAPVLYFFPGSKEGAPIGAVTWLGNTFIPIPMDFTGADVSGKGAVPRPMLSLSNLLGTVSGLINQWGGIRGAVMTRWETFTDFLDDGSNPDSSGYLPLDVWFCDRIAKLTKIEANIECRSYFDHQGTKLPRRQVLRDMCPLIYRVYNVTGGAFDYTNTTCPYTAAQSFDATGAPVSDPRLDVPSKQLGTCCIPRFKGQPLPFGGFPGVGQFQ